MIYQKTLMSLFVAVLMLPITNNLIAQEGEQQAVEKLVDLVSSGIQVGDKVPDVLLKNIHNYDQKEVDLAAFIGDAELLILDFWATWCTPCVAALPKIDSLKAQFAGKVKFLSITYEGDATVLPFWSALEKRLNKKVHIPFITNDTLLRKFFPHRSIPHYVWIDGNGIVISITEGDKVNAKVMSDVLAGNFDKFQKEEYYRSFDRDKPLFMDGNGGPGKEMISHSVLSNYVEGLPSTYSYNANYKENFTKISLINTTLERLYATAYGKRDIWILKNRIKLDVANPNSFTSSLRGEEFLNWMRNGNGFCHEVIIPGVDNREGFSIMQEDLSRTFPQYHAELKVMPAKCLALVKTELYKDIRSVGGEPKVEINSRKCFIQNASINYLVSRLMYFYQTSSYPLINATDLGDIPIDLDFETSLGNIVELNKALAPYGLSLKEGVYDTEILVISDN